VQALSKKPNSSQILSKANPLSKTNPLSAEKIKTDKVVIQESNRETKNVQRLLLKLTALFPST
jgi:hypothetical protein